MCPGCRRVAHVEHKTDSNLWIAFVQLTIIIMEYSVD